MYARRRPRHNPLKEISFLLRKEYDDNSEEIVPYVRMDLSEAVIDQKILEMNISQLEVDFIKYLHMINRLKKNPEQNNDHAKLASYTHISEKIETQLNKKGVQPEYIDLIKQIFIYGQTDNSYPELVTAAAKLATTFKFNKTETGKETLRAATLVLTTNSLENRNQFLDLIDRNRSGKFKLGGFVIGSLLTFAGAAMIAAGIACAVTGVGAPLGIYLIVYGTAFVLAPGIVALRITALRSYGPEETSLVNFGDGMIASAQRNSSDRCTASIGIFSVKKEKYEQPDRQIKKDESSLNLN